MDFEEISFKKLSLILLVGSLSICALICIIVFLFWDFDSLIAVRLILTTLSVGSSSLVALCCATLYDKDRYVPYALTGIITSVIGFLLTFLLIWEIIKFDDFWRLWTCIIILSVAFAQSCLLFLIMSESRKVMISLYSTIFVIAIVTLMLIIPIMFDFDPGEFYTRLVLVFIVLDVLGTIVTPILNKVYLME